MEINLFNKKEKNFAIMMPPPNVTGSLHIGHALTFTLQDIITRYKRMDGFKTLWQPGTDHAGIATQNVVEKQLLAEGTTKEELGRENSFRESLEVERVFRWYNRSSNEKIRSISCLVKREIYYGWRIKRGCKEAFVHLYNEGMIVQNNYMVNWCTPWWCIIRYRSWTRRSKW